MTDDYCKQCDAKTRTVYNAFMVAFCSWCGAMKGTKSDYAGKKRDFICISCGRALAESYVGQSICSDCDKEIPF